MSPNFQSAIYNVNAAKNQTIADPRVWHNCPHPGMRMDAVQNGRPSGVEQGISFMGKDWVILQMFEPMVSGTFKKTNLKGPRVAVLQQLLWLDVRNATSRFVTKNRVSNILFSRKSFCQSYCQSVSHFQALVYIRRGAVGIRGGEKWSGGRVKFLIHPGLRASGLHCTRPGAGALQILDL